MAALAEGLATNQILLSLLLSSNEIRPAGLEALASSLLRNKALLELVVQPGGSSQRGTGQPHARCAAVHGPLANHCSGCWSV